jgi:hypothetical protein
VSIPGPGWFIDPADSALQRWWSGQSWTEHTRSNLPAAFVPAPLYVPEAPVISVAPPTRKERDRAFRRNNGLAYAGAILALASLLFNIFCIPSILAIVFASIGVATASRLKLQGHAVTGMGWSVAGIVIGSVSTIAYVIEETDRLNFLLR